MLHSFQTILLYFQTWFLIGIPDPIRANVEDSHRSEATLTYHINPLSLFLTPYPVSLVPIPDTLSLIPIPGTLSLIPCPHPLSIVPQHFIPYPVTSGGLRYQRRIVFVIGMNL
jgi:hypothetical protein